MNKPVAIERAQVGRCMHFPRMRWDPLPSKIDAQNSFVTQSDAENDLCNDAVAIEPSKQSQISIVVPRRKRMHLKFHLAASSSIGSVMSLPLVVGREREKALLRLSLQNSKFLLELFDKNGRSRSSVKEVETKDFGNGWSEVELHLEPGKVMFTVDKNVLGTMKLQGRARSEGIAYFGVVSSQWKQKLADSPIFNGCLSQIKVNGFGLNLDDDTTVSKRHVSICTIVPCQFV